MNRLLPLVALVALSLAGCQEGAEKLAEAAKNSEMGKKALAGAKAKLAELEQEAGLENGLEDEAAEEALDEAAAAEADGEALAEAAEPEPVKLDAATVKRALAFQDEMFEVTKVYLEELKKDVKKIEAKAEEDEGLGALGGFARMAQKREAQEEALEAEEAKLLKKHDVTEAQVDAVNEIVGQVAAMNMGDLAGTAAKMREALENSRAQAPEGDEGLANFEAQVQKMEAALKFTELREQYGDEPVDAVLARKDEVVERYKTMLGAAFGR